MKFRLTPGVKAYAEKNLGVAAGSADSAYTAAVKGAVATGKLAAKTINGILAKEPAAAGTGTGTNPPPNPPVKDAGTKTKKGKTTPVAALTVADVDAAVAKALEKRTNDDATGAITPAKMFSESHRIRIKGAAENYSAATKAACFPEMAGRKGNKGLHPYAGQQAKFGVTPLDMPSELDKAVSGAWVKWCLNSQMGRQLPANLKMTDHDRDLVMHAMHTMKWTGHVKGRAAEGNEIGLKRKKLSEHQIKALLDDTESGGIEITPAVFDDAIILYPILYGELFPFVNLKQTLGRRIKGGSMLNPTITAGTPEGAAITPIDTSAFFRGFDTPIFVASGAMTIGLDFEEDTPVDFGSVLIEKFQEVALEKFDYWVANGNGYNEPLGLFNTSGLTLVGTDFGVNGPPTVADYEALMFGMAKKYRAQPDAQIVYVSNDTTYARSRGIKVGPTDQRRVFGMDHEAYTTMGHPHKVQNDIANSRCAMVNLHRYRMYQRAGTTVRMETAGRQLALTNTKLLVVRMRFGGQMEDAGAVSASTDFQE